MNDQKNVKEQRFSSLQKWSFGMGSFAQWFINSAFNLWVFSFYFSAVKLNVNYIMLAFIIWTIWNAFNDPIIGYLSDRTSTRWGRRKPYIMVGTIPIIILEIIIWTPPTSDEFLQFIYLLLMLLCYDTFYTMIALPFDSLFPELYTSVEERAQVNTIKQILAIVGLIAAALVPGMLIGELDVRDGYLMNGVVTSIIVGASLLFSLKWGVVEREEFKLDYQQHFNYFEGLKYALKNKGFILYTIMFFLYEYILLLLGTIVPLFVKHVLGSKSTFDTSIIMGIMYIIGAFSVIIWKKLDVKIGSRKGYVISIIAYFITTLPFFWISSFDMAIIDAIFMGIGFGGMLYFIYLIIADVIDEDELKTGIRREGTFFGVTNFFMRLAMIFSIITVSLVFTQTGWEEYQPNPGIDVILGLRILFIVFPGIALGITLICLKLYPFTKSKVDEMKKQLYELHAKKMEKVQTK